MTFSHSATLLILSFNLLAFSCAGCRASSTSHTGKVSNSNVADFQSKIAPVPEANIFVDDVMLSRPYALIGGIVQNVGNAHLEKLSIEIELRRRDDNSLVKRAVKIQPFNLAPGEKGKFSLKVLSDEWSSSRVLSLRSEARQEEIVFDSLPGAKRPAEKLHGTTVESKAIPRLPKSNGEEFLNTPDTPVKIP